MQLYFTDETRIEAFIQWNRTDPYHRLSDHLNECPRFFPITASFGLVFVNRQRLRQMRIVRQAIKASTFSDRLAGGLNGGPR